MELLLVVVKSWFRCCCAEAFAISSLIMANTSMEFLAGVDSTKVVFEGALTTTEERGGAGCLG